MSSLLPVVRISNPDLVQKSGFLDTVEPGDHVMADRSFTILDALTGRGAHLTVVHRVSAHGRLLLEAEKSGGGRLHA